MVGSSYYLYKILILLYIILVSNKVTENGSV